MTGKILPFEHWCTDGGCGARVIESCGGADKVERWRLSIEGASWGFNTETEAREFAIQRGYEIEG